MNTIHSIKPTPTGQWWFWPSAGNPELSAGTHYHWKVGNAFPGHPNWNNAKVEWAITRGYKISTGYSCFECQKIKPTKP